MTSPSRSYRDEASAKSPLRNAFASSSKPQHSPFLARRPRPSTESYTRFASRDVPRQPDAISTSSSTLVNAESTEYRPWEVQSESGSSSLDVPSDGRATPTLQTLDEIGTLPSIHITPLVRRSRISNQITTRSDEASPAKARSRRQLCPDDCRCSDQDIDLGLCRRVVGSSSSGSDSGSLSVGLHPTRRESDSMTAPASETFGEKSYTHPTQHAGQSQQSSHSLSEPRSQGRDFEKDPILVPRAARRNDGRRSPSTHQRSFDQLQRGLDTLDDESDAESDAEQALAAQRRAESMARWTARRSTLSPSNSRSSISKLDASTELAAAGPPLRTAASSLASDASKLTDSATPLKVTPARRSIAAVFESMQKEREARAAAEAKQWREKQARNERERAARAFGVPGRRRISGSSSQMDSPGSVASSDFATPTSQGGTTYQSLRETPSLGGTTFRSVRETPSRSTGPSASSASPMLSSLASPKVDEGRTFVNTEKGHRQVGDEIAETDTGVEVYKASADDAEPRRDPDSSEVNQLTEGAEAVPSTTSPPHHSAFAFSPQPMALDLSPISDVSTPASSPRKNAHRRSTTISAVARTPPPSLSAARQRLSHVLGQSTPKAGETEVDFPRTPTGILASARKSQLSAARRGHSVRFSPRPDYRSDSGSWDDSAQHEDVTEGLGGRLLPAKEITIPAILAEASMPASLMRAQEDEDEVSMHEEVARTPSPVEAETVSRLHTPRSSPAKPDAATSFSQSLRFPGAYAATPQPYSRHVIRPSPNTVRILPPSLGLPSSAVPRLHGLFPSEEEGDSIPRESTPPPPPLMLGPEDPRNSPRSPRPVDLGRRFETFQAGSSDESKEDDVGGMVEKMLTRMQRDRSTRATRRGEFRDRLKGVDLRLSSLDRGNLLGNRGLRDRMEELNLEDEGDRERVDELKEQVMHALALLADRIVHPPATQSPSTLTHPPIKRNSRRRTTLWILAQCALIAYLLKMAERKAVHLRMFHPPPPSHTEPIDWSPTPHLPLLPLPLFNLFPPLPPYSFAWTTHLHAYSKINGLGPLLVQLVLYSLDHLVGVILLLACAPIQLLLLIHTNWTSNTFA